MNSSFIAQFINVELSVWIPHIAVDRCNHKTIVCFSDMAETLDIAVQFVKSKGFHLLLMAIWTIWFLEVSLGNTHVTLGIPWLNVLQVCFSRWWFLRGFMYRTLICRKWLSKLLQSQSQVKYLLFENVHHLGHRPIFYSLYPELILVIFWWNSPRIVLHYRLKLIYLMNMVLGKDSAAYYMLILIVLYS